MAQLSRVGALSSNVWEKIPVVVHFGHAGNLICNFASGLQHLGSDLLLPALDVGPQQSPSAVPVAPGPAAAPSVP